MLGNRFLWLLRAAKLSIFLLTMPISALAQERYAPSVMITGSNRGIGLEFAAQYADRGWRVIATARRPDQAEDLQGLADRYPNVIIEQLDVTDELQIVTLVAKYSGEPIDVLINNAGVAGPDTTLDEPFDSEDFHNTLAVNTFAPLRVSQAFLGSVLASESKKIILITSVLASLENAPRFSVDHPFSGHYYYKISKAGASMAMRILHGQLQDQGVKIGIFHAGPVATDMLAQTTFDLGNAISTEQSVSGMMNLIDALEPERSGRYFEYDGTEIPW